MLMNFFVYSFKCANCNFRFLGYGLPEGNYGEFILRTRKGEVRYLNALDHPVVRQINLHFDKLIEDVEVSSDRISTAFQSLFKIIFDPADNGDIFEPNLFPPCPKCGFMKMAGWGEKKPLEFCEVNIDPATNSNWAKLSDTEKDILIKREVSKHIDLNKKRKKKINWIALFKDKLSFLGKCL